MHSPVADHLLFRKAAEHWAVDALPLWERHYRGGRRLAIFWALYATWSLSGWVCTGSKWDLFFAVLGIGAGIFHSRMMDKHAVTAVDMAAMRGIVARIHAKREMQELEQIYDRWSREAAHG